MSSTSISLGYCPFPLCADPETLGLSTSPIGTRAGTVSATHGRRSASDTATVGTVIAALASEARPRAFSLASARAGRYDAERSWSRIDCPVRATHGDTDVFVAGTGQERLSRVIRDFAGEIIPGTGHFGHVERPYETLATLLGRSR